MNNLKIWRYEDPVLGPRKIPVIGDYTSKCADLDNSSVLKVDTVANKVELVLKGINVDVGKDFLYTYDKSV